MKSLKVNGQQLDLFAQDFSASPAPEAAPSAAAFPSPPPPPSASPLPLPPSAPPRVSPPPVPHKPAPPVDQHAVPDPARAPDAPPLRQLQLGPHTLEYVLRRSTRRSIGFMIDDDGLRVTAPKRISLAEIDNAIRAKQGWILSKLHERRERRARRMQRPPVIWIDGAALPYLGGEIVLRLHQAARHRASFNPHTQELHVWLTPLSTEQQLKEKVRAWMQQEARRLFEERLDLYSVKLGEPYHSFALSSAGTRWGSCTVERKIRLNWRLIQFALPLIDYVVAHELSHLREMNHSARFWATVESIYPDYDGAKQALRKRAQELPVLFS
ncbi:MAG TPA: SprT family zinc-dependent metalloprotease [Janthinobacterium sp.]|jgi:predicted metal-dependent hydrolase|nr:SprT family zinc-dependent metalloprotease [Janthinobacterium sp.]